MVDCSDHFGILFLTDSEVHAVHPADPNGIPGAPLKPEVTDIGQTSVTLSWKSNPSAGAPPSSYLIEAFRLVTFSSHST